MTRRRHSLSRPTSVTVRLLTAVAAAWASGCAPATQHIEVPGVRAATSAKAVASPYVVRLVEGGRTWEVQLPAVAGGYEVRIPIGDGSPLLGGLGDAMSTSGAVPATASGDAAALGGPTLSTPAAAATALAAAPGVPAAVAGANAAAADRSVYLEGVARVTALYQRRSYELALSELDKLLRSHPDDAKLLAMQGTLYWKLGDKARAQLAWERVIMLEPENEGVLHMLEGLP